MKIDLHPNFKKSFKKRISHNQKLISLTNRKLQLFVQDQTNPVLKDHALKGSKKSFRAFSVSGDCRIIYKQISKDHVIFYDIGTHNQVY